MPRVSCKGDFDLLSISIHSYILTFLTMHVLALIPTEIDYLDGIEQRVQIQFPLTVWDILWDSQNNRVLVVEDSNGFYEIESDKNTTILEAMRAIGYHSDAFSMHLDYLEISESMNLLNGSVNILGIPVSSNFLMQLSLTVRTRTNQPQTL
jgi:hypothetical protein